MSMSCPICGQGSPGHRCDPKRLKRIDHAHKVADCCARAVPIDHGKSYADKLQDGAMLHGLAGDDPTNEEEVQPRLTGRRAS